MDLQVALFEVLPFDVQGRAVDLRKHGVAEFAYPIKDADRVLQAVADQGWTLLGGDLWESSEAGPKPTGDNWYADPHTGEPEEAFARRSAATARRFIRAVGRSPTFLLTLVLR